MSLFRARVTCRSTSAARSRKGKEKVKFLSARLYSPNSPCRPVPRVQPSRRATRAAVRVRWRAPDDLGHALVAFRRALWAHRRLARLAPSFFDSVVVERERREREAAAPLDGRMGTRPCPGLWL